MAERKTIWERLRVKHRVAVINEETLEERLHMRLSLLNFMLLFTGVLVLTLGVFALLIWLTPLKNYLPGYNENIKQELVDQTYRVDSLQGVLDLQTAYLNTIRDVVSGNVHTDSVPTLDSLELLQKQEMLAERSKVLDEFISDYEAREKDNLMLFDQAVSQKVTTLFRPVQGVITESFDMQAAHYGITVETITGANITATLTGTIVYENYVLNEGWMMMVQHDADYLSLYYGLLKPFKPVGATVQAGETLGLVADGTVRFELWQKGLPLNPEEVISF